MTIRVLAALERAKDRYGAGCAETKLALLGRLERADLRSARAVWRLHEALCFLRAYPDDARVLTKVERMLARFAVRADLRREREALVDSGIAGTVIRYRFFWSTLRWLAQRWPGCLAIDRSEAEIEDKIASALPLLLAWAVAAALNELDSQNAFSRGVLLFEISDEFSNSTHCGVREFSAAEGTIGLPPKVINSLLSHHGQGGLNESRSSLICTSRFVCRVKVATRGVSRCFGVACCRAAFIAASGLRSS